MVSKQHYRYYSIFCTAILIGLLSGTSLLGQTLETAPFNPAFTAQQQSKGDGARSYGYVPGPVDWSHLRELGAEKADSVYPERFDWRDTITLTPIKDQGVCGACWAFSTCAALEAWCQIHLGESWDFSENHMKNTHGFLWDACAGGNDSLAMAYLSRWSGPLKESDDPYNQHAITGPVPGAAPQKRLGEATLYADLQNGAPNGQDPIKAAVMNRGPVITPMTWKNNAFDVSSASYYYNGSEVLNHMITIVGWDNNKTVVGAPGKGAWICKNSWGTLFGDHGYFFISYYDHQACKIATGFYELTEVYPWERIYQYDPLGHVSSQGFPPSTVVYAANVFQAEATESLVSVGTYVLSNNANLEIIIYDGGAVNYQFSNPLLSFSVSLEHAGYHVIALPEPLTIEEDAYFTVRIRYETPGMGYPIPVEISIPGFSQTTGGPGQSYFSPDGVTYEDYSAYMPDGNICIKAMTGHVTPPSPVVSILGSPRTTTGTRIELKSLVQNIPGTITGYVWVKDGVPIPGEHGTSYVILSVDLSDAGVYQLQVMNDNDQVYSSTPFILEVLPEDAMPLGSGIIVGILALGTGAFMLSRRRRKA
ncbi:MAG: C1 family peptidase [Candidatus Hydrogenedentales bacterium]|jgi:C1A family cysteine protease